MKKESLNNPLVVASAAQTEGGQKVLKDTGTALRIAFLVAGSYFIARYGYKQYKKYRASKYARENAHTPEVQAALLLHNAMFSTTFEILSFEFTLPDGTDEDTLNKLALEIDSLESVSKAYKILFDRTLLFDVQSELNSSELQTFFNRLKAQGSDNTTPDSAIQPYNIGEPLWVRHKQGIVLKKAEFKDGKVVVTDESKGRYNYAEKIGIIHKVILSDKEVYYMIDRDWKADSIYGYGYANHRDVFNRNPDKL